MTTLLATKLHQPVPSSRRVQRPSLIQRLNEGLATGRQITLVSAPAGFGKTTCVSAWVNALDCPVTWLSLDAADDDPGRFLTYLVAALQKADENLGREIEGVLRAGQLPPAEVLSANLINDILAWEGRCVLVLDDFQVIQDRFILQFLEKLLDHLPRSVHLVLLTREDPPLPLARLRANNQMTEIRAKDLRFTEREAARFLNEVMGLSLSPVDVAALEERTEGWIVGLQLAALALRSPSLAPGRPSAPSRTAPTQFIATLSGSHRFILSYLTEQVLDRQPPKVQRFLLQTAILDQLSGDLCDAVTGRTDSRFLLERLFNANLFLIPLDDEGRWYRYHRLFADLLRDLQNAEHKGETTELHRRASQWYTRALDTSDTFIREAIQHALDGADYALALDLLESHAMDMIMQGYAKTVNGWVQAIPSEWEASSPRTYLAFAWMHLLRGAYAQAAPYLERVQAIFSRDASGESQREESASLRAEWLVMQSLMLNMHNQPTESMALATQALEIVPERDERVRSLAYYALAGACQLREDYPRAVEAYQMAIQHGRAAENLVAEMMSISGLALMAFEHGQLHLAFEIAEPVSARLERFAALPPISAVVYGMLGEVGYQWLQLDQARRYTLRALGLSTLGGYNSGMSFCRVLLSRLSQLEGDLEAAAREIQKAVDLIQGQAPTDVRQEVVSQQVRVYLARNRSAAAEMALQGQGFSFRDEFSFPDLSPDQSIPHALGLLYNSSLHVLLYRARAGRDLVSLKPGIALAGRLIRGALQGQYRIVALEALLLRAQMHAALGDDEAGWADYVHALELAEPEGFIGVFVQSGPPVAQALAHLVKRNRLGTVAPDYVRRILDAFSRSDPSDTSGPPDGAPARPAETGTPALIEPLTDRELDVLRLMAEGLTYNQIAARLFISLNTVRFHVKAIYGKLDVNNRTQAIKAARQLQIL